MSIGDWNVDWRLTIGMAIDDGIAMGGIRDGSFLFDS
jgi:hypothetical protein